MRLVEAGRLEEHRAKGGNPDVDVSYQYLRFFLKVSHGLDCLVLSLLTLSRATKNLIRFVKTTGLGSS